MRNIEDVRSKFGRDIVVCDSTLTLGQFAPGVVLSNLEKYKIASLLDDAGVPQIECGSPRAGGDEQVAVKHIANMGLDASVMAASKGTKSDVEASLGCDFDSISLSLPTSDIMIEHRLQKNRAWVIENMTQAITLAKEQGLYVVCCAEDAARTDLMFLIEFAKVAKECGADRLRYCDSIGRDDPFKVYERVESVRKIVGIDMEIQARNDFGIANAVALGGLKGGARFITTSVLGIGERAGITALEEIVMVCQKLLSKNTGINTVKLKQLAEFVSAATNTPIYPGKPILGKNCFSYEFGMHSESVSNNIQNDEPYAPDEVGLQRKVVIGRNVGSKVVISQLSKKGIEISREDAEHIMVMVRKAAIFMHRSITDDELMFLYEQYKTNSDPFDESMTSETQ